MFAGFDVAGAQPVPVPFPPVVLIDVVRARRNIGRPCPTFAQHPSLRAALQVKRPCVQQCFLEQQILLLARLGLGLGVLIYICITFWPKRLGLFLI